MHTFFNLPTRGRKRGSYIMELFVFDAEQGLEEVILRLCTVIMELLDLA